MTGCFSFCRHCRKPLHSGDQGVHYLQAVDGEYYMHHDCLLLRPNTTKADPYPSQPHHEASDRTHWHARWRRQHPVPPMFTPEQWATLVAAAQRKKASV